MIYPAPISVRFDADTRNSLKRLAHLLDRSESQVVQETVKAILVMIDQPGREEVPLIVILARAAASNHAAPLIISQPGNSTAG